MNSYHNYKAWVKLRAEGKVPPAKPQKKESGYLSDYLDSIRDGSCT